MKPVSMLETIRRDIYRHTQAGGGFFEIARLTFLNPGFQFTLCVRLQSFLGRIPFVGAFLRRILWYLTTTYFSCDVDPAATFGPGIYFPHPIGIVIGGEWDLGADVTIQQGVTLGRLGAPSRRNRIGDGTDIGAGAKILGEFDIGQEVRIGANAVVLSAVPDNATAVGVPARIITNKLAAHF